MSLVVAIVDPRVTWCATLAALLIKSGFQTVRRWTAIRDALPALLATPPNVLLVSRLSCRGLPPDEMLSLKQRTRIVLVVDRPDGIRASALAPIGIDAIMAADATPDTVSQCLASLTAGRAWVEPAQLQPRRRRDRVTQWDGLSVREREVAELAAQGLSNKRIARKLQLSDGTVKIHMHHILSKLRIAGRSAIIAHLPVPAADQMRDPLITRSADPECLDIYPVL